jgi:hypothetical protein
VKNSFFLQKKRNPEGLRRRSTKGGGLDGYALASVTTPILSDRSKISDEDSDFARDKTERTRVYLTATLLNYVHN